MNSKDDYTKMMTPTAEQARASMLKVLKLYKKNNMWRGIVEYLLDDDDIIISSFGTGSAKATWRQVKEFAEQWSEEE
jgi:hypothetical protein